jgi:SAM-dependent methyltransferase
VAPDRIRWALQLLDPQGDDRILEVGSGPGVAAALVCDRLTTGRLLAVDRSSVAIERTSRRNAAHLAAGRLAVHRGSLADVVLPPAGLDKAFAIDVNLFWVTDPGRELTVLGSALRPGAPLHLLYGSGGPTAAVRITEPIAAALREHRFTDIATVTGDGGIGVSARAPGPRSLHG